MYLNGVTFADAGLYLCTARSRDSGETISKDILLEVVHAPEFDQELSTVTMHPNGVSSLPSWSVSVCLSVSLTASLV